MAGAPTASYAAVLLALAACGCASIAPGIHTGYFADARIILDSGRLHPRPMAGMVWPYQPHPVDFGYRPARWTPWPGEITADPPPGEYEAREPELLSFPVDDSPGRPSGEPARSR